MPLPLGESVTVFSLEKVGYRLVERMFFVRRGERLRDWAALSVPNVLHHLVA